MFSDKYGLTQAVLEGRKTQTRRIAAIQPPNKNSEICIPVYILLEDEPEKHPLWLAYCWRNKDNPEELTPWIKPKYKEGEVVAIAQSYESVYHECGLETMDMLVSSLKHSAGWTSKMFVRADLMSHRIRITKVRIQRLQNISDDDCLAEGIKRIVTDDGTSRYYVAGGSKGYDLYATDSAKDAYAFLINRISGKGTWESNPYVWVYEFELVK